jgi:hypothetical protein
LEINLHLREIGLAKYFAETFFIAIKFKCKFSSDEQNDNQLMKRDYNQSM